MRQVASIKQSLNLILTHMKDIELDVDNYVDIYRYALTSRSAQMYVKYKIHTNGSKKLSDYDLIFLRGDIGDGKSTVAQMLSVIKDQDGKRCRVIRSDFIKKLIAVHLGVLSDVHMFTKGDERLEEVKKQVQSVPSSMVYKIIAHHTVFSLLAGNVTIVDSSLFLPEELQNYIGEMDRLVNLLEQDFGRMSVYELIKALYPELTDIEPPERRNAITGFLIESLVNQPFAREDMIIKSNISIVGLHKVREAMADYAVVQPSRPDEVAFKDISLRALNVDNLEFLTTATPEIRKSYAAKKNANLSLVFEGVPAWISISNSSSLENLYSTLTKLFSSQRRVAQKGVSIWREMFK